MSKKKTTIVHLVTPYLFHTGSWVYSQLTGARKFRAIVFTQKKENLGQFPFDKIYSPEDFSTGKRFVNKVYRRVFDRFGLFFDGLVQELKPRLFHAHFGFEAARWLEFVEKTRLPLVTTFYGQDASKLGKIPTWRGRYTKVFGYGNRFLVEGTFLKKQLMNLGCPENKIIVQHLGVELDKYPQKNHTSGSKESPIVILQVSTFREKKGIEYSLDAISRVRKIYPNIEYRLIGAGDNEESNRRIVSMVKDLNLEDCVKLLGIQQHRAVIDEMSSADIFLHPSVTGQDGDNEGGAPVCIIEASAVGLPVVSTLHADIPEVVIDEQTGFLVPERNSMLLAERISA